ncbi:Uncharacterized protein FWK35_00018812 [Aphis craccivora]|uniref:Uncharacterized protein n=1 Tax=Aphis craccivora TaxID=307492 RepID=A0A6G0Y7Q4_APHCR|nr:Uncharacterized protein FWK35_00018812 [Aphis craccivora]
MRNTQTNFTSNAYPPGSMLEFDAWKKAQRHPIVIYADFEALLRKSDEKCGSNHDASSNQNVEYKSIQKHEAISYDFIHWIQADDFYNDLLNNPNLLD